MSRHKVDVEIWVEASSEAEAVFYLDDELLDLVDSNRIDSYNIDGLEYDTDE